LVKFTSGHIPSPQGLVLPSPITDILCLGKHIKLLSVGNTVVGAHYPYECHLLLIASGDARHGTEKMNCSSLEYT